MFISVGENVLNIVLNTVFIYGLNLGVAGAAIASCISFGIGGIAMFLLMLSKTKLRPTREDRRLDREILSEIFTIGLPALGTTFVSCFGYIAFARMVSGMGTTIFAAHSIAHYSGADCLYSRIRTACGDQYIGRKCTRREGYPEIKATERVSILITY